MGILQSSINNLLGTIAVASKLSPTAQDRAESAIAERNAVKASATMKKVSDIVRDYPGAYDEDVAAEVAQKKVEADKALFYKKPDEDTFSTFTEGVRAIKDIYDIDMYATQRAERELARSQKRVRNSEFFRTPTQSIEQDLKEIGGNQ